MNLTYIPIRTWKSNSQSKEHFTPLQNISIFLLIVICVYLIIKLLKRLSRN